jgi:hypothetical protein
MKDLESSIINIDDKKDSISEKVLSESLTILVREFTLAKDFSKKKIKAMSMLRTNSIFKELIDDWIENMKHDNGKYRKDCKKLIKNGFEGLSNIIKTEKEGFLMSKLRNRFD